MLNTILWSKWRQAIAAGELQNEFLKKQVDLHPEMKNAIFAMSGIQWFGLVKIEKRFFQMNLDEINKVYDKAVWLVENVEYIKLFQCNVCGKITYFCEYEQIREVGYWDLYTEKSRCHSLTGGFGQYGSSFDMDKIQLDLCERCYGEIKAKNAD